MFTLHPYGRSPAARRSAAEAHELHQHPTGPFDGELLDLYVAILIVVPFALFLKSVLF